MEGVGVNRLQTLTECYAGRRVLVTGHTGFKGSWLCQWLLKLGATVRGYALDPPTTPSLFNDLHLSTRIQDVRADVRDKDRLLAEVRDFQPEFVFHLAAQPLVRYSYAHPVETYETNVMGTVYLLEALRLADSECAVVIVTTDKCYENREWVYGYREDDPMGGADPYSSSKGMAELAVSAWRRSFCGDGRIRLASARAGNVIGGGDWALDRIIPDCIRAIQDGKPIGVRNPKATRPWQHVLDPLSGYLLLGVNLDMKRHSGLANLFCSGFNFGPRSTSNQSVASVVSALLRELPGVAMDLPEVNAPHEANLLHLCIDKAEKILAWTPQWDFLETVQKTANWYAGYLQARNLREITDGQLRAFEERLEVS